MAMGQMMDSCNSSHQQGSIMKGRIARYSSQKGYGFLTADGCEDIFFLREEMPQEIRDCQNMDDVIGQVVDFEVRVMPDGKLRALRMNLLPQDGQMGAGQNEFGYQLDPN